MPFIQLVKTTKPTGDGECPSYIERAHEIEYLMNDKAGSRDLDDEEIVDTPEEAILVSSDDESAPPAKASMHSSATSLTDSML